MATFYGNQYQDALVTVPSKKVQMGDIDGKKRVIYFDYTVTAAPTAADVIKVGVLPAGARVINAGLSFPDLGTAGVLNLGWAAGVIEVADADGLLVSVDVNAAADAVSMQSQMEASGANAGYMKKFSESVVIQIDVATAWTATTGTIKGFIEYALQ